MQEFNYDKKQYRLHITLNGIVCVILFLVLSYLVITSEETMRGIFVFFAIVAGYSVWNTFISASNPERVVLNVDSISFSAYGKNHKYKIDEIESFRVKEFKMAQKQLIRINGGGFLKGRYWVHCAEFENGKELYKKIADIELSIHPKCLKAIARNGH